MTRVIAGAVGGRRLTVPRGRDTRPTSDRAREGLFGTVGSLLGPLEGLRVMDLYAGSGAVGLEAASRGAGHVLLVESAPAALRAIRRNARDLALPGIDIVDVPVSRLVHARSPEHPYDLVFADPPYTLPDREVVAVLRALRAHAWLATRALVVLERSARGAGPPWPEGYREQRVRRYGDAALWYGLAA